jgi:hypothetical protein
LITDPFCSGFSAQNWGYVREGADGDLVVELVPALLGSIEDVM